MTKAGRRRKLKTKRHPSGRTNTWENPRIIAIARRSRDQIERTVSDPRFGFPLGLMHATRFLTDEEFEAAVSWTQLTFRFSQVVGIALPVPKAVNWNGSVGLDTSPPNEVEAASVKAQKARLDGIIATADSKGLAMMIETCIEDRPPWARLRLKKVLAALAEYRAQGVQRARRKVRA